MFRVQFGAIFNYNAFLKIFKAFIIITSVLRYLSNFTKISFTKQTEIPVFFVPHVPSQHFIENNLQAFKRRVPI